MPRSSQEYTELFVLMLGEHILTPAVFSTYWKNYGGQAGNLYGWRPPKKIYYTLGQARCGLAHVPAEIRSKVTINKFTNAGVVASVAEILEHQKLGREKKQEQRRKRDLESKQRELEAMRVQMARMEKELQ